MALTWIVVAHRAGCRLLESIAPGKPLALVEEIDHSKGRYQNKHIDTDKPGRTFDETGPGRSSYSSPESPHDHVAKVFAGTIAKKLDDARNANYYDALVLVAEPKFLGMLRDKLGPQLSRMVRGSVTKDLYQVPVHEIAGHLGDALRFR